MKTIDSLNEELPLALLDIMPNPVLVKDHELRYVFVNKAFEELFGVSRQDMFGDLDINLFKDRQAAQCNGGDMRVLGTGKTDEAYETVFRSNSEPRETITRKSRLELSNGEVFLVGVMHDITDLTKARAQLEEKQALLARQAADLARLANTDFLTECLNRRALFDQAGDMFSPYGNAGSVLMLDIDHFKSINDRHGHDVGDQALVHLATTVKSKLRPQDHIARLGGEEFAVMLPGADREEAKLVAERLREAVEATPLNTGATKLTMTVSVGAIHKIDKNEINLEAMLKEADESLYKAKQQGRNQIVWCEAA